MRDRGHTGSSPFRLLHALETGLLTILLGAMVLLAFGQIVFRNFFDFSLIWADPFLRHLVLWVGLLGAALATREGKHIRIDIIPRLLNPRWRTALAGFTDLFSAVVCATLCWAAVKFVRSEFTYGGTIFLQIPGWVVQTILPAAFLLIALRFLLRGIRESIDAWKGENLIQLEQEEDSR